MANSQSNKRCGSPIATHVAKCPRPEFSRNALKQLYGTKTTNPQKRTAFNHWSVNEEMAVIASKLGVSIPTVEVYIIDLLADGEGTEQQTRKILQHLNVGKTEFWQVADRISKSGIALREIKDGTDLKYNQITAVLASLIHGTYL
ncbi:hypothetical protein AC249_AIPGENE24883 [Exaiptasia diaphana]|nr:hypothetical protein AC249_AIPGENE24883 [Exaiptasia diaphana]